MRLIPSLFVIFFTSLATSAPAEQLLVGYSKNVVEDVATQQMSAAGYRVVEHLPFFNIYLIEPLAENGMALSMGELREMPGVAAVDRNIHRKWIDVIPHSLPTGTSKNRFQEQETEVPWGVAKVNAPDAWPSNQGTGIKVAVIDTGIDKDHPDLMPNLKGGYNAFEQNDNWEDDHSHGTHVAGTIGAVLNNAQVVGVAPNVELYAVKVLNKDGGGDLFSIMRGMQWVAQNGMHIGNMSLGSPQENMLFKFAVDQAANAGVIIIAAAGNDGKAVNWPAAYPNTIAVSAMCPDTAVNNEKLCTDGGKKIANFSSRGPEIEFITPGVLVPSTIIGGEVQAYSGTSMACPHLAGLAALAMARGAQGIDGVRKMLKSVAVSIPGLSASEQGAGMPNANQLR